MSLEQFLRLWCARGSQGLQADWLKPHELRQSSPAAEPDWVTERRERIAQAAPYAVAPRTPHQSDREVLDADPHPRIA